MVRASTTCATHSRFVLWSSVSKIDTPWRALSTYLGHTNVTDTYWYLEATPIIMGGIAEASEAMQRGGAS